MNKQEKIRERRFEAGLNNPKKDRWARRNQREKINFNKITSNKIDANQIKINATHKTAPAIKQSWWQRLIRFIKGLWKSKR